MKNKLSNIALRTTVLYVVFGAIWILTSDIVLITLFNEPLVIRNFSIYKGWFFILATAVLLYFGLLKQIRRWEQEATERKLAQAALNVSEEQYRMLFESTPVGLGLTDMNGRLIAFNNAMLQPGGYSRSDIENIGSVASLYYNQEQREEALSLFRRNNQLTNFPVQFKRKDGTPYDTLLSLSLVHVKGEMCIQSTVQDITELRRVERKIRENEMYLAGIIDSAMDAIVIVDEKQSIILFNRAAEKIFGYSTDEIIGQPLHKLIPEQFRFLHEQHVQEFGRNNTISGKATSNIT